MTPERYQQVKQIFQSALDCEPDRRAAFLAEECNGDELLISEVETLLAFQERAETFIEKSAFEVGARLLSAELKSPVGLRIGQYELIAELGHGGMGAVYLAARADEQFKKQVAIKIVRRGLDTEETRRRFRHERQILATLDHPNIAKLLDGGATREGLPYLVMDYVEGVSVTEYCDARKLSTGQRLQLFRTICSAVHYAHQRLVIHRDIKPGNILVTSQGVPKLLDFGIAKLLDPEMSETMGNTAAEMRLMTPEYASPEQVRGLEVTTASDVYSLGVLLYQLLTGHRPYRLITRRPEEIAHVICDQEPERPSIAIRRIEEKASGNGQAATRITPESVSKDRGDKPDALQRKLKGDLDNIILMAMQKDPSRRYASVEQFSEDIRRHAEGLPVIARKDTLSYRTAKFVRRHSIGVGVAGLLVLTLLAGIVATMWQARVASRQRDQARLEKVKAERINALLQEMLSSADPLKKGGNVKAAELLADAARRANDDLANQPEVQAEVRRTIGNTYVGLGLLKEGEELLRLALEAHGRIFGNEHPQTAKSLHDLGLLFRGKGEFDQAETVYRQALAIQRRSAPAGDLETAATLQDLGIVLFQHGKTDESEKVNQESLALARSLVGNNHSIVAVSLNQLGLVQEYRGNLSGAENLYRQSLDVFRAMGPASAYQTLVMMNLGTNLVSQKKYDDAEAIFSEAIKASTAIFGPSHPNVAIVMTHYGRMYYLKGDYVKAEEILRRALEIQRNSLPAGHPESAQTLVTLGIVLTRARRPGEGESYLREALQIREKALPKGHWTTANVRSMLGECLMAQRRYAEAEPLLRQGHDEIKRALGERHPRTLEAVERLIQYYESTHQPREVASYRALLQT